jgi:hypothetical protein
MHELQLLSQKFEQFSNASPKQRSNAMYLSALTAIVQRLTACVNAKAEIESTIRASQEMHIRAINVLDLARQVTLLQFGLFKRIDWRELSAEPGPSRSFHAPNLTNFLSLSTYLTQWCQYEVLRYETESDRVSVLGHLIKMANHMNDLGNYEGVKCIAVGLMARPIHRLNKTKALLPKRLRNNIESLDIMTSERRNFAQLEDIKSKDLLSLSPILDRIAKVSKIGVPMSYECNIYTPLLFI